MVTLIKGYDKLAKIQQNKGGFSRHPETENPHNPNKNDTKYEALNLISKLAETKSNNKLKAFVTFSSLLPTAVLINTFSTVLNFP